MRCPAAIRSARSDDVENLVGMLGLLFSLEQDFTADARRQRNGLASMLKEQRGRQVLVAELEGRVVGMATAQMVVSTAEGGPAALVEDVVVLPGLRGRGIGRALMARIESWAAWNGATRLQLLADKHNSGALAFYAACGWKPTSLVCLRRSLMPENAK